MAEYNARWEELQAEVRTPEERDLRSVGERGAEQAQVLSRYTGFMAGLAKYIDWRDRALNDALPILKEESSSATGIGQQSKWIEHFSRRGEEAFKTIVDLVKEAEKIAPELRRFGETVAQQESAFFAELGRATLAFFQGRVQQYTAEFHREKENLEKKWKALEEQDRPIDQKLAETSRQILKLFEETVAKVTSEQRGLEEKLRDVKVDPSQPMTGGVMNTLGNLLKMGVQSVMEKIEPLRKSADDYNTTLLDLYKREETMVVLFTQIREAVREFLSKTNLDTAIREFNEATRDTFDAAGRCPTSKQRDDAKRLVEKAIDTVKPYMEKFKNEYEVFVGANRGTFVGPVSPKTIDDLLEPSEREHSWEEIERFNIQGKLQEIYDRAVLWNVDIDGLTDEAQKELKATWEIELERLGRGIVAAKDDRMIDQIKALLKDRRRELAERAKSSKGGLE
jgi:chaperonin cofactor prefoldin